MASQQSNEPAEVRAAIARLHETHYASIARYCALRIGNLTEAEDLASEVFIRAIKNADRLRNGTDSLIPWLYRTAHHLTVDHLRRRSRRGVPDDIADIGEQASGDDVQATVERTFQFESLLSALNQLTDAQREIIALRFSNGLKAEEIAVILNKSPGAIRQMQYSALEKLREVLRWDWPPEGSPDE